MLQLEKSAAPDESTGSGFVAQARVAPAVPVPLFIDNVTDPATGLPPASVSFTTGWVPKALPPAPPPGSVAKAMLWAAPAPIVKALPVVERLTFESVAVSL